MISSKPIIITVDSVTPFDFSNIGNVKDFALFNTGTTNATVEINGVPISIKASSSRTFSGYEKIFRNDRIGAIVFVGGTGNLELLFTVESKNC
jgi:hypothetical protein